MDIGNNGLAISRILQEWYHWNKRDLPWRENAGAYRVWISEIILQQTRVNQGMAYFLRFMEKFPDVQSLASASEEEVLKLWQGLGYYSRARNLHAAAKQIIADFDGVFPHKYADVLSLKGVGKYTAAAITSIAYNLPHAVIDGNVNRVLSRLFAVSEAVNTSTGEKIISEIAHSLLDTNHSGLHNQAIMDFGAMICTPTAPKCDTCPLQHICLAFDKNAVTKYPVKKKQKNIRHRYFTYFHIEIGSVTYIYKRNNADIWKNLYEFPLIETDEQKDFAELQYLPPFQRLFKNVSEFSFHHKMSLKHVLSHQIIHAEFFHVSSLSTVILADFSSAIEIRQSELQDFPISRLTHKYLETIQ